MGGIGDSPSAGPCSIPTEVELTIRPARSQAEIKSGSAMLNAVVSAPPRPTSSASDTARDGPVGYRQRSGLRVGESVCGGPSRAARAYEYHIQPGDAYTGLVPERVDEAQSVGIGAEQPPVPVDDSVDCPDSRCQVVNLVQMLHHRLLMRHGDISAQIAIVP